MTEIYRRYDSVQPPAPKKHNSPSPIPQGTQNEHHTSHTHTQKLPSTETHHQCTADKHKKSNNGILQNILPGSLYNPETKKILGILSAEDLLLIALIFLFLEDNNEDNPMLAIALIYVLISDYIDLGDLGF